MNMRRFFLTIAVLAAAAGGAIVVAQQPAQQPGNVPTAVDPNAIKVYIRAGLKSHGPGLHDYPQYLADWSKVLTERGAVVDGSFHFPTDAEIKGIDVIVMYKGDAGYMTDTEKATLDAFVKRGGGIVSFHDSLCGPDTPYMASIVGGAKKHGEVNYSQGDLKYTFTDKAHPIMQGMTEFTLTDEAFLKMTWAPSGVHPLATVAMPGGDNKGEVVPQIWTYEHTVAGGQPARAFVWMQGHLYTNFADPKVQPMILRGIAWAAKKPIDALMTVVTRERPARTKPPGVMLENRN